MWRTLGDGAASKTMRIKIRRKGEFWKFVEILPPRKLKSGEISIALLPLIDMSQEKDQGDLCDIIADGILNTLSKDDALHVISKEFTFVFKGQDLEISKIGEQLNVSYILEGSVSTADNQVKIVLQLTRVDGNSFTHIWSDIFNVEVQNVLTAQDKIVSAILDALKSNARKRHE